MKTFSPTPKDINHEWFVVDAQDQVLGRLASQIAHRLRGKLDRGAGRVELLHASVQPELRQMPPHDFYRHERLLTLIAEHIVARPEGSVAGKPSSVAFHCLPIASPRPKRARKRASDARFGRGLAT